MMAGLGPERGVRFARSKFRPTTLPGTLVTRPVLHDRLAAGAVQRLTVVVGSAGAGKSVLLSSWAATRAPAVTSWLSCDEADANPVRFWTGFIEAPRAIDPEFGADAADLLAMDGAMSADVTASLANDAAKLPAGSAIVVDDFHTAAPGVSGDMTGLIERWPAQAAQLVLAGRIDPPLRLHRLRMAGELCELRDHDLSFSFAESQDLLANFGVPVGAEDLAVLHQHSEGWAAALQMAALSLRGARDPGRTARALEVRGHAIAEYFIAEVLDQQPPQVAAFMLDTSVLEELTAGACAAVTGSPDAAALLRAIDAANLFVVPLDDERSSFRYHHLARRLLRAELRSRSRAREQELQLRAAEWFESVGDTRHATRHFLAAQQPDRALTLLQDRVVADFLNDPALPAPLDLSAVDPALLAEAPDRLLAVALELLMAGDVARGGEYLDLFERSQPSIPPDSRLAVRFAAARSTRYGLMGQAEEVVRETLAVRAIQERTGLADEWAVVVPINLPRAYEWLDDDEAVEREAVAALARPELSEPVKLVLIPGIRALAWFQAGHLSRAADTSRDAQAQAQRLGFDRHFFAVEYLRARAGLALEQRDLDTAEQLTEQALAISERRRPFYEFLTLLDRAGIWAARGQVHDALATVEEARPVLAGTGSVLLARADELEALLRLSLGDPRPAAELARGLPAHRRELLQARIALADGDYQAAQQLLRAPVPSERGGPSPRRALVRRLLLAAAAIGRGDSRAADALLAGALGAARRAGFLNTVITTSSLVTGYLIEHATQMQPDPFTERLIAAALQVRAAQPEASGAGRVLAEPLTATQLRILRLLPTSNPLQIATTLYISRNTVKTHLRSIYQKLGVASRPEAVERAVELHLL
jgi:LuxR family transcriptional regulator, maltose regulon positive regulatory protein